MDIDYTSLAAFLRCRRLWHYTTVLDLEPSVEPIETLFGSVMHMALEQFYATGTGCARQFEHRFLEQVARERTLRAVSAHEEEDWEKYRALGCAMAAYYEEWAREHDAFSPLLLEWTFRTPIFTTPGFFQGFFQGRIDGLVRDENGELWLLEFKTRTSFRDASTLVFDLQSSLYQWAMQQEIETGHVPGTTPGEVIAGVAYTELRKVAARRPEMKKTGGLSQAAITTTYALYRDTILACGEDPALYQSILDKLASQPDPFVRRLYHRRTHTELVRIAHMLREVYHVMDSTHLPIYPSPDYRCAAARGGCSFAVPCQMAQQGGNETYILATQFRPRTHHGAGYAAPVLEPETEVS